MRNQHRFKRHDLAALASQAMLERGLEPEFPPAVQKELAGLPADLPPQATAGPAAIRDLRALPWCSIDNDDSLDLDQLTTCQRQRGGGLRLFVAVADVDVRVPPGSAIDQHAQLNTCSVYTSARIFPMLPERLSTDLSSLNPQQDRLALVTEMLIDAQGELQHSSIGRAWVRNQAKLAYDATSAWLLGEAELPAAALAWPGMDEQLRLQDAMAQTLRARRHAQGSLEFETLQPRVIFEGEKVLDLQQQEQNRARQLIEEFMIATNGCCARFLAAHGGASLRRVVRSPERWARIVEEAHKYGEQLPNSPDAQALEGFLARRRRADPLRFPDLSLVIVKLMGAGEYVVERPGSAPIGHFGLAEREYTHSTAPNRRYPDLISQRMIKACLAGQPGPYSPAELEDLALHCTRQEDAARKVERRMRKSEAALFLEPRIGEIFAALVTGRGEAGTWVRVLNPPVEGMLVGHAPEMRLGQRLNVRLVGCNIEKGFIDFAYMQG
ncbi:ribonuclease II [Paucibacter sp. KBW04]|uniref:RNB domain-containing ribonuclease n=1 Tax=Paucibacter sp. KBW04 TaxID=2153361 RepID=UPI000F57A27A|nr:RNB domain-containing ribonuclease [Paucibacter sp. KBW04]RQO57332.1 ribonuclease II [Paucibacter sp. KBW04]